MSENKNRFDGFDMGAFAVVVFLATALAGWLYYPPAGLLRAPPPGYSVEENRETGKWRVMRGDQDVFVIDEPDFRRSAVQVAWRDFVDKRADGCWGAEKPVNVVPAPPVVHGLDPLVGALEALNSEVGRLREAVKEIPRPPAPVAPTPPSYNWLLTTNYYWIATNFYVGSTNNLILLEGDLQ